MGSSKLKKFDKNRFRKIYPRFRKMPIYSYMGDAELVIEAHEVTFTATDEVAFQLKENYTSSPNVTCTPMGEQHSDVNIFIAKVEIGGVPPGGLKAVVTIRTSTTWTGTVFLQAVKAG